MAIKVMVNGAFGKMGQLACAALENDARFELIAQTGRTDSLAEKLDHYKPEVVVDLTSAEHVFDNAFCIVRHHIRPVIGTTGLFPAQIESLTAQCEKNHLGGLIVPNFSIGAVLMMKFSQLAAPFYPDIEIVEAHHPQKKDAPSGTAMKTATDIAQMRKATQSDDIGKELIAGARGARYENIPIHSIRMAGVLAEQTVYLGHMGETLSITHRAIDRSCYMPGLLLSCAKVMHLSSLHYGLESILDELV